MRAAAQASTFHVVGVPVIEDEHQRGADRQTAGEKLEQEEERQQITIGLVHETRPPGPVFCSPELMLIVANTRRH